MTNYQDAKGIFLLKEMRKILEKEEETYYQWHWYKPNNDKNQFKKTGFFKKFSPLNIFVGTGEYVDDYEKGLRSEILTYTPKIKFSNNGFIFIIDYQGNMISHPNKSLIGKNVLQAKDRFDTKFVKQMIAIAKKGDDYVNYFAPSISMDSQHLKTSYIKGFNEWEWLIGAGFYQSQIYSTIIEKNEELNKINNKYLITMIIVSFISTIILLGLSILLSHNIQKKFLEYKKKILEETKKNREKDYMLAQQSKMAAMGEMLANVAHQWRQPLSAISTSSSGLKIKHQLGVLKDDDIEQTTDNITKYTQYLSKTLENFRNFFKPTKERKRFNIEHAIDKTLDIFSEQIHTHQILVIKEIEPAYLFATENDFMQVIMNIIHNSCDVLISRHIVNKIITITVSQDKDNIIITIRDNAGGIKDDIIDRIFEPYFTTKHQSQGTGIGLYMSKEIIMKHMNSSITARNSTFVYEDQKYVGAKFIIRLKKY